MPIQEYIGKIVVLDTQSDYLFLGTLTDEANDYYTLENVDVHDHKTTSVSKDVYLIEAAKFGIKASRKKAYVCRTQVVSISLLEDVIQY